MRKQDMQLALSDMNMRELNEELYQCRVKLRDAYRRYEFYEADEVSLRIGEIKTLIESKRVSA